MEPHSGNAGNSGSRARSRGRTVVRMVRAPEPELDMPIHGRARRSLGPQRRSLLFIW